MRERAHEVEAKRSSKLSIDMTSRGEKYALLYTIEARVQKNMCVCNVYATRYYAQGTIINAYKVLQRACGSGKTKWNFFFFFFGLRKTKKKKKKTAQHICA